MKSDIKGFYKQQKKRNKSGGGGGVAKPKSTTSASASASTSTSTSTKKKSKSGSGATVGASQAQTPALLAHGTPDLRTEEYSAEEERLRQFDMDMRYGPCLAMSRLDRWKRAAAMGLRPPADVAQILSTLHDSDSNLDCLWEGRI